MQRVQFQWLPLAFLTVTAFGVRLPANETDQNPTVERGSASQGLLPSNLQSDAVFRPFLEQMLRLSPTFRRQCNRLAATTNLRVSLRVEDRPRRAESFNARTELTHEEGSLVRADVFLAASPLAVELIGHELEHIVERLDGVDLQAQAGNGVVWKIEENVFETRRAMEMGRRIAREARMGPVESTVRGGPPEKPIVRSQTAIQQDRDPFASSAPPSARVDESGHYVVFTSSARLVDADRNQFRDIYVLDLTTRRITLESAGPDGSSGDGESTNADISRDGRYVVFESLAGNLTATPFLNGTPHVFLRHRANGTTRLLSSSLHGGPANGWSANPAVSADGTHVVFQSTATDLAEADNALRNSVGVYLVRLTSASAVRLDVSSERDFRGGQSASSAISADGRLVVFMSRADLTCRDAARCAPEPIDTNGVADIYLCDTRTSSIRRITHSYSGGNPDGPSYHPAISGDGRYVAYVSEASNLTRDSSRRPSHAQVYIHDLLTGMTELVTRTPGGRPADGDSLRPALSHDGSTVAFQSLASNLLCEGKCRGAGPDINLVWDVFVHDRSRRVTMRASADGGDEWMERSRGPSLDGAGRIIAFASLHPRNDLDRNHDEDLFVMLIKR